MHKDPFLPPFEEGLFISELSPTHTLLFNKFQVCKEHVLVVTTKFERQDSPLDRNDIEAVVKTMLSLDAFMYFNQGPNSGASQPHKHMQLIPFASLSGGALPVEQAALKQYEADKCRMFRINQFKSFEHIVGMLDFGSATFEQLVSSESTYMTAVDTIFSVYWECLHFLGITHKQDEGSHEPKPSYNVWITPRMVFVVLREKNSIEGPPISEECPDRPVIDVNTLGFAGTIAAKN